MPSPLPHSRRLQPRRGRSSNHAGTWTLDFWPSEVRDTFLWFISRAWLGEWTGQDGQEQATSLPSLQMLSGLWGLFVESPCRGAERTELQPQSALVNVNGA